jgi:beta-lactamase regulating signal transducer with metallopeptidase domain
MIKVSLIILLGLAATALLRRRSAAVRHWVLAAAIGCAAAIPVLERVVPVWHLPVVPFLLGRPIEPLALFIPVSEIQAPDPFDAVQQERSGPVRRATALRVLGPIWMAGVGISVSFLLVGFARLAWLASRSRKILQGTWTDMADTLSRAFGLGRPVVLLQSDHPTLLVTWGLRQPKVILPRAARDWPEDCVRVVLGHELAHIQRGDWLVQMAAELLRSVYWFNPLVWIACRRLRRESEHACDDAVLGLGVDGPEYATHLLDLACAFRQHRQALISGFPAPAMVRPSSLERRIRAMLNARLNRTPITRSACIVTVIALLAVAIPIAGLVASAQTAGAAFSGSLVDAIGRILPDVPLALSNVETRQQHEARSDEAGHFSFAGLPAGEYLLEARKAGFATTQGRLTLGTGQNLQRDVALQIGSIQETITIARPSIVGAGGSRARSAAASQPEVDPCSQSLVGGCIQPPRKLVDVRPQYPPRQWEGGIAGDVEVDGRIGTDGFLKELRLAVPADPDFATAALEAIGQWRFTPTHLDGVMVETAIHVTAHFIAER